VKPDGTVLHAAEYVVESIPLSMCVELVRAHHYAQGGPNTATFRHGLFHREDHMRCLGVAWWLPPTRRAAEACWPSNWQAVLTLSRLVVAPEVPQNGASFLLARSVKLIRRDPRWECLVTYADEGQGHTGAIYRAANWEYAGMTGSEARWVDSAGRMVARKAGPTTRTAAEMRALGHRVAGRSRKHRFRMVLREPSLAAAERVTA
jgi:hypothetical protein